MGTNTETDDALDRRLRISAALFYVTYGVFYVGLWFHDSSTPTVFGAYSAGYLALLLALAAPLAVPVLLARMARRHGSKSVLFVLAPVGLLLTLGWFVGHFAYDYTREYAFDPYLQLFGEKLEAQHPKEKAPGTLRVLTLGGSTTRNHRLEPQDRYPRQLEAILREAHPDRTVEVVNAGQNWWTSKHSLINYVTYAEAWNPDIVVVMHAINDVEKSMVSGDFTIGEYDPQWRHHYASSANAALAPTFEQYVLRLTRGLSEKWFSRFRMETVDYPLDKFRSVETFEENLRRIVRYAHADGAEVLVVTQPSLFRDDLTAEERRILQAPRYMREPNGKLGYRAPSVASLKRVMEAFNDTTRRVASETGARLVEGAPAVPKTLEYFIDDVHYTPAGARALAEAVAERVIRYEPTEVADFEGETPRTGAVLVTD